MRLHKPSGFTLIELMVALMIASILTLVALPAAKEALRQHTVTRNAEVVRQYFLNARAQAIRQNRPFGVVLKRTATDGVGANYCKQMSFATGVPTYSGDSVSSVAYVVSYTASTNVYVLFFPSTGPNLSARMHRDATSFNDASLTAEQRNRVVIRDGALITLDEDFGPMQVGRIRTGTLNVGGTNLDGTFMDVAYPWPNSPPLNKSLPLTAGPNYSSVPFEIKGFPQQSFLPSVNLSGDAVVDLSVSGIGTAGLQFNREIIGCDGTTTPYADAGFDQVMIMFDGQGDLDEVIYEQRDTTASIYRMVGRQSIGTIYVAIGRADGVEELENVDTFDTAELYKGQLPNYANPETIWVTVRGNSGAVGMSPQPPAVEDKASYYTARTLSPPSGVDCALRQSQVDILTQRVIDGRRLARSGRSVK
ncbi:hypothetical protein Poly51_03780 [Rubripirellula tenax]|uniref:Major pilin subunit n=1 Tax=Rubripirellula tenax TaxID=2528015 RepID=A0A5C6FK19_9BACT|nr:prepilin-type N-terminal cleavage/methylation domain-containing protein [Rubripirellula tenax]TWU60104.1 hypothetical protein Poly51_03780 [Rubripirellula tenax]